MLLSQTRRFATRSTALTASRVLQGHFHGVFYGTGNAEVDTAKLAATAIEGSSSGEQVQAATTEIPVSFIPPGQQHSAKLTITPSMTTGQVCDQVLKLMAGPGRQIKGSLVLTVAQSIKSTKDLPALKSLLTRCRQKQTELNERVVYEITKCLCRINASDEVLELFSNPKQYGLFPSRRVLHSLILRYGSEAKLNPERFQKVLQTWEILRMTPGLVPNVTSRVLLLRASVLAKSDESFKFALNLLQSPEAPQDLANEKRFLFWTVKLIAALSETKKDDLLQTLTKHLTELKNTPNSSFPPLLATVLRGGLAKPA